MERKIHFRENWLIFLGIWGEAEIILGIRGSKEKYFLGAEEFIFRDYERSMHYFPGSREHRLIPPERGGSLVKKFITLGPLGIFLSHFAYICM